MSFTNALNCDLNRGLSLHYSVSNRQVAVETFTVALDFLSDSSLHAVPLMLND